KDVIMCLPNVSEDRVDQFIALRGGPDGPVRPEDDGIRNLQGAEVVLGTPPGQLQALGATYVQTDTVWRVVSVGKSGEVTRTIRVVILKGAGPPQLQSWKEF